MKFRNFLYSFIAVLITLANCFGQSKPPLYFAYDQVTINNNRAQERIVDTYNLRTVRFIYQVSFAPGDKFDSALLVKNINELIPNKEESGIVVLDWEGRAFKAFKDLNAEPKTVEKYVSDFVEILKIAKRMRPNMKWGYFELPFPNSELVTDFKKSREINNRIIPIIKASDYICPSFYMTKNRDQNYFKNNVLEALRYGKVYNKDVYATIWHRVHRTVNDLSKTANFRTTIEIIAKANYNGKKIDGLFWWNEENYRLKKNSATVLKSRSSMASFEDTQFSMFSNYFNSIKDLVK